ncbi:MAG: PIN domain-containing protein [Candidatus Rokubacteria bacterium]|nr:PIN domain-containing protein [Candidatus Rokubacteria bacterium]
MKTAVDSSVLLDVFGGDADFGEASLDALRAAYDAGPLVACDVVWAEVRAHFEDDTAFRRAVGVLGVRFEALGDDAAAAAGRLWRLAPRPMNGVQRRLMADFLIGAHAMSQADALLTRDRGFYRRYFDLNVIDPTGA